MSGLRSPFRSSRLACACVLASALLAVPAHAQSSLRPRLSVAYGLGKPLTPGPVGDANDAHRSLSAAADVSVARLTRVGLRFDHFAYDEPRSVVYAGGASGTVVTPARAQTLTAFLETGSAPIAGARLFFWVGPTVVQFSGDEIVLRSSAGGVQRFDNPRRWGGGLSAGLGTRWEIAGGVSLLVDGSVNALYGLGPDVAPDKGFYSNPALRLGVSFAP